VVVEDILAQSLSTLYLNPLCPTRRSSGLDVFLPIENAKELLAIKLAEASAVDLINVLLFFIPSIYIKQSLLPFFLMRILWCKEVISSMKKKAFFTILYADEKVY
jgi:hypothetical protein